MADEGRRQRVFRMEAAGAAALAEAGLFFLPLMEFSAESVKAANGPLRAYGIVAPLFALGVVVGVSVRHFRVYAWAVAAVAGGLAMAQAVRWGDANAPGTVFLVVLSLLVGSRVVSLAGRDWREPVKMSFVWGGLAALLEVITAGSANTEWRRLLPLVVVLFFAGSLASRAASVMLDRSGEAVASPTEERRRSVAPIVLLGGMGGILAASAVLGGHHGLFRALGGLVARVVELILLALGYVTAWILLRPISWVLTRLHFTLAPLQRLIRQFTHPVSSRSHHLVNAPWIERLLGLAVLIATAVAVVYLINRLRRRPRPRSRPAVAGPEPAPVQATRPGRHLVRRPRPRRQLPADLVRRWYAEALLLLERRGIPKPPGATPAEYLSDVARAFPACGRRFESLTRTYEDVRYGNRPIAHATLRAVDEDRRSMMDLIRRSARADLIAEGAQEVTEG